MIKVGLGKWGRGLILVGLFLKGGISFAEAPGVCFSDPELLFTKRPSISIVYACPQGRDLEFCTDPQAHTCKKIRLQPGLEKLTDIHSSSPRKQVLATYLSATSFQDTILVEPVLSIQTGKYPLVAVSATALNSKCMTSIVQAAYRLQSTFPNYSFVIDAHIQNCQNLREGIRQMLAQRERVQENLNRFHSPLHSVYLTNQTRFVSRELGRMGLYVNVNREGEIRRRLIEFEISAIPTDMPRTRLTGLAN